MNDEQKPEEPKVEPTSLLTFGHLNVLIFKRTSPESSGVYINIRRTPDGTSVDPGAIPLTEVPALISMLKEIVPPAIGIRSLTPQKPPEVPPSSSKKRVGARKKS